MSEKRLEGFGKSQSRIPAASRQGILDSSADRNQGATEMKWDSLNLDAPHTQRELYEIKSGGFGIDVPAPIHIDSSLVSRLFAELGQARDEIASLKAQLADRDYRC